MVKTAKQGARDLQRSAAALLEASRKASARADRIDDDVERLALLVKAQADATQARALGEAATNLARGHR